MLVFSVVITKARITPADVYIYDGNKHEPT